MTIPYERTLSLIRARELLFQLATGDGVDLDTLRRQASSILKHFPTLSDIDLVASEAPNVFAKTDAGFRD